MGVSKVEMNTENGVQTIMDLTNDTVTEETLAEGATAHDASGNPIEGIMKTTTVLYTEQTLTNEQKAQARENIDAPSVEDLDSLSEEIANYTLGLHTDGLLYLFDKDGQPQGNGIALPSGATGDVTGNVDSENNLLLSGNIPSGTYTVRFVNEDGTYSDPVTMEVGAIVKYTITQNLTAVTSDNSVTEVRKGESLTVNLTANDGYNLSTVAVTMGGTDVSATAVSGGKISIASVTGDVIITAVAEEEVVTPVYTNLLPKAVDTDGSLYNGGKGYKSGYKMSGSSGGESATTGAYCSGFIPYDDANKWAYIKNVTLHSGVNVNNIILYDANKTKVYSATGATAGQFNSGVIVEGDVYKFRASNFTTETNIAFFRFSCGGITDETIVTVNEEIA